MIILARVLLAICLCLIAAVSAAQESKLSINNPARAFGYTVGDVLEQTIVLNDEQLTLQQLPLTQREGRWITRQDVRSSPDGQSLNIRYQIINAPTKVRAISLPALSLNTDQGLRFEVPAWSFSIAPLMPTTPADENNMPVMQADWTPDLPPSNELWRNIKILSAALLLSLLLWLTWWLVRGMLEARCLPFAHAYQTVRRHKTSTMAEAAPDWLALHRAFDQMSGRSVSRDSIDTLVNTAKWLEPFEAEIRKFYAASSQRFFANDSSTVTFDLVDFSLRLYKAEKRNASKLEKPASAAHDSL